MRVEAGDPILEPGDRLLIEVRPLDGEVRMKEILLAVEGRASIVMRNNGTTLWTRMVNVTQKTEQTNE